MKKSLLVDQFVALKAEQKALEEREESLKKRLLALNDNEIEGTAVRITISRVEGRLTADVKKLKEINPAVYDAVVKRGNPITRFNTNVL